MSRPVIVPSGGGELLDLGNFEAVVLASASDTSNAFTLLQTQNESLADDVLEDPQEHGISALAQIASCER